jgi:regulator of sirC expression with transglutaminase-like and TPR domain
MNTLDFATVARRRSPELDELALAMAAEFRGDDVDADAALAALDRLGAELATATGRGPEREAEACRLVLGERHGFHGNRDRYDDPDNSMLDLVLERRTGLPILLSVVYVETARRAGIELAGVGLPGHYVVGHFGADPPLLLDPFTGGVRVDTDASGELVRPWRAHETALRMLNNLVASYDRRGDLGNAIAAAELRLELPLDEAGRSALERELIALRSRLN